MSSAAVVKLALQASLGLLVIGVGLRATLDDATFLLRRPSLLVRSVLSINVVMPLLALWMAALLSLGRPVELAIVALAISPLPPFLPLKTTKVGAAASYTVSLLAMESLIAILVVPLTLWIFGTFAGLSLRIPSSTIGRVVGTSILIPLAVGIAVHWWRPRIADRIAGPTRVVALIVLIVALVPLLVSVWRPMTSLIGNGTVGAIVVLAIAGLGIGHVLGGPNPAERPVLALSTATRHPAVAIAVLGSAFPNERLAPAAVLLAVLTAAVASIPYMRWIKNRIDADGDRMLITPSGTRRVPPSATAQRRAAAARPERRRSDRRRV